MRKPHSVPRAAVAWFVLSLSFLNVARSPAAEPPELYERKTTWTETMLAARAALKAYEDAKGFRPSISELLRGGETPHRVSVDIIGVENLVLIVTDGGDGPGYDHAIWAEAKLLAPDGTETILDTLDPTYVEVGWNKFRRGETYAGTPLEIGGRRFKTGLWAHARSELRYAIAGKYKRFEAWVGISDLESGRGSVRFQVLDGLDPLPALWDRIESDFPAQCERMAYDAGEGKRLKWFRSDENVDIEREMIERLLAPVGAAGEGLRAQLAALSKTPAPPVDKAWLELYEKVSDLHDRWREARRRMREARPGLASMWGRGELRLTAPRQALEEVAKQDPDALPNRAEIVRQIESSEARLRQIERDATEGKKGALDDLKTLAEEALDLAAKIAVARGWPTYQADPRRTGVSAERLRLPLTEKWAHEASAPPSPAWPAPAKANLSVSVRRLSNPVTYDRAFHPVVARGRLYYGSSSDDAVHCLDAATGGVLWTFVTEGPVRLAPAVAGDAVFAGSDDGFLYALDARTGRLLWRYRPGPGDRRLPGNGRMISLWPVRCGIVVEDGVVYVGAGVFPAQGAFLCAIDAASGREIWKEKVDVSPQGPLLSSPTRLFVPTGRTPFTAFSRENGKAFGSFGQNQSWGEDLVGGAFAIVVENTLTGFQSEDGRINTFDVQSQERIVSTHGLRIVVDGSMAYTLSKTGLGALDRAEYLDLSPRMRAIQAVAPEKRTDWQKRRLASLEERRRACLKWEVPCAASYALIVSGQTLFAGGDGEALAFDPDNGQIVWAASCAGKAHGLAVCDGRLYISTDRGVIHCFGPALEERVATGAAARKVEPTASVPSRASNASGGAKPTWVPASEAQKGYCLILGRDSAGLAERIAERSDLRVICRSDDSEGVDAAREELRQRGLYGDRVVVHQGGSDQLPYPPRFANLVVLQLADDAAPSYPAQEMWRVVRPYGGVLSLHFAGQKATDQVMRNAQEWSQGVVSKWETRSDEAGLWLIARRGPVPGAGEWTHLYAEPGNSACSGDVVARGPMDLQWFGRPGPRDMADRHHHTISPLSKDGRVFTPGYGVLYASDIYNGAILWRAEVPESRRLGAFLDCGSMALDAERLYLATGEKCLALNVATGERQARYPVPRGKGGEAREWGYIARSGDSLFGSGTKPGAPYRSMELRGGNRFYGQDMEVVMSEGLFALDPKSGRVRWTYEEGAIPNTTIAIGGGRISFVESANPKALASATGRMRAREMFGEGKQYLVSLNAETGDVAYKTEIDAKAFEHLVYLNYADGMLLLSGSRVVAPTAHYSYQAFDAATGEPRWTADHDSGLPDNGGHGELNRHPTIVGGKAYAWPYAYDLRTGERDGVWKMDRRGGGCGGVSASAGSLFWRGSNPWMCDLGGAGDFRRLTSVTRPGCWINIIPAGGLVLIPEASSGCTCSFSIQTSMAFAPR